MVGLWEGKTEFDIAGDRLQGAIDAVLSTIRSDSDEATPAGEVIVPLVGFHMPKDEIELDGVRIVRGGPVRGRADRRRRRDPLGRAGKAGLPRLL